MLPKQLTWTVISRLAGAALLAVGLLAGIGTIGSKPAAAHPLASQTWCPGAYGEDLSINLSGPSTVYAGEGFYFEAKVTLTTLEAPNPQTSPCEPYKLQIHLPPFFEVLQTSWNGDLTTCEPPIVLFGIKIVACDPLHPVREGNPMTGRFVVVAPSSPGVYSVTGRVRGNNIWDTNPANDTDVKTFTVKSRVLSP
jgi:hypothetical protein